MPIAQKLLRLTVQLADNTQTTQPNVFSGTQSNTMVLEFRRARVRIQQVGAPATAMGQVDVWGLSQSRMNELSTLGIQTTLVKRNTLQIDAGDAINGLTTIYKGTIFQAYGVYQNAPDVPMHFDLQYGLAELASNADPNSFTAKTSAETAFQQLSSKLGLQGNVENNGITVSSPKPIYLKGSLIDQLDQLRNTFQVGAEVINGTTLAIFPKNGYRTTGAPTPVLVGPPPIGQMKSYPAFAAQGVVVETIFDPRIQFFGQIEVRGSTISQANAVWRVVRLDHDLDSMLPGGQFKSVIWGYNPSNPNPVVLSPS